MRYYQAWIDGASSGDSSNLSSRDSFSDSESEDVCLLAFILFYSIIFYNALFIIVRFIYTCRILMELSSLMERLINCLFCILILDSY